MARSAVSRAVRAAADPRRARTLAWFFKTGPGEYGEGDRFLGITVPTARSIVRAFRDGASWRDVDELLGSPWHEERLVALLLLVDWFRRGDLKTRRRIYSYYLRHADRINNWDLVDLSAHEVVGAWLSDRSRAPLLELVRSPSLWERRIAVVATYHFIRRNEFGDTLRLAELLLDDREDLMHKACGWMLREVGKRDTRALESFLERHCARMPRTMLRYAIERFPERKRLAYLRRPSVRRAARAAGRGATR